VTIRHHALESGSFVVNATGWLNEEQIAKISPTRSFAARYAAAAWTAIVSPEGPATSGGRRRLRTPCVASAIAWSGPTSSRWILATVRTQLG